MQKKLARFILGTLLCVFLSACNRFKACAAIEFRRDEVVAGVAALSVRDMGMLAQIIGDQFPRPDIDEEIITKQKSKKKKKENEKARGPRVDPKVITQEIIAAHEPKNYGKGTVTLEIKNQTLKYDQKTLVYEDCKDGRAYIHKGAVIEIIKAQRIISGRLTGDKKEPVIPDANQVSMYIEIKISNFKITMGPKEDTWLKVNNGKLSFRVLPRLARNQSDDPNLKNLLIVPTNYSKIDEIKYSFEGMLVSPQVEMPVKVSESEFYAQIGEGVDGSSNTLWGWMEIFDEVRFFDTFLDPDYNKKEFLEVFDCHPHLKGIVDFEPYPIEEKIAPGPAGLSVLAVGQIIQALQENSRCGFKSKHVLENTEISGLPGSFGEAVTTLPFDCELSAEDFKPKPDCFGNSYEVMGGVRVNAGTKITFKGLVLYEKIEFLKQVKKYARNPEKYGDSPFAVIPATKQSTDINISMSFNKFSIAEKCVSEKNTEHKYHCTNQKDADSMAFFAKEGVINARFKPVLGKVTDNKSPMYGLCAEPTYLVAADFVLKNLKSSFSITNKINKRQFRFLVNGEFTAISGKVGDDENILRGRLELGSVPVNFLSQEASSVPLKPNYIPDRFNDSFRLCTDFSICIPERDEHCSLEQFVATQIARLMILNTGPLLKVFGESMESSYMSISGALKDFKITDNEYSGISSVKFSYNQEEELQIENSKFSVIDSDNGKINLSGQVKLAGENIRYGKKNLPTGYQLVDKAWSYLSSSLDTFPVIAETPDANHMAFLASLKNYYVQVEDEDPAKSSVYGKIIESKIKIDAIPYMDRDPKYDDDAYTKPTGEVKIDKIKTSKTLFQFNYLGAEINFYIHDLDLEAKLDPSLKDKGWVKGKISFSYLTSPEEQPGEKHIVDIPQTPINPEEKK